MFTDRVDIAARRISRPQGYASGDIAHWMKLGRENRARILSDFKIMDSTLTK